MKSTTCPALALALAIGCGAGPGAGVSPSDDPARPGPAPQATAGTASAMPNSAGGSAPQGNPEVLKRYTAYLSRFENLTVPGLKKELGLSESPPVKLSFDPAGARYFKAVTDGLRMTPQERAALRAQGVVNVDHGRPYSMASAYFAIYTQDLPVLITTDSILHALHRSYDEVLKNLEVSLFTYTIENVLALAHEELGRKKSEAKAPGLAESVGDVDLYLTVARNLLAGAGAPTDQSAVPEHQRDKATVGLIVPAKTGRDAEAAALLSKVSALRLERPEDGTVIYGGYRPIDYSQFRARGHYTESAELRRYFRTMIWLGRADTGFIVAPPAPQSGLKANVARERRNAALLTELFVQTKGLARLTAVSNIIDFLVGGADNLGPQALSRALATAKLEQLASLADDKRVAAVFDRLGSDTTQQIRSQVIVSDPSDPVKTPPPPLFQLFGQRFLIDSFVLSQVVYDSIIVNGEKVLRGLPTGLDVAAALGNDEAVRLLQPELEKYQYSANLLAARRVVDDYTDETWRANLYNIWLDALRTLDDVPAQGRHFPQVMRTTPWARKQLQTQLASWAELRHDTLLYAKQSYTAYPKCEYPEGYVEPYPAFYRKLKTFAQEAGRRLAAADVAHPDATKNQALLNTRDRQVRFFRHFESVMAFLEKIAEKELGAKPFTPEEAAFLEKTIDIRGGGSGPPRYDGWYPQLIYGGTPADYEPTVADVHTKPGGPGLEPPEALEVATGNVQFLVVAVDNEKDRALYVGPSYSYYEFTVPPEQRLTDEAWKGRLGAGNVPKRPAWIAPIQPAAKARDLEAAPPRSEAPLPPEKQKRLDKLREQYQEIVRRVPTNTSPEERQRLIQKAIELQEQIRMMEGCGCPPGESGCVCE